MFSNDPILWNENAQYRYDRVKQSMQDARSNQIMLRHQVGRLLRWIGARFVIWGESLQRQRESLQLQGHRR